jgi:hypothetical protein
MKKREEMTESGEKCGNRKVSDIDEGRNSRR